MKKNAKSTKEPVISTLFLDVGGVLLSNGWDRRSRKAAAKEFDFDYDEMEERHHLTFDTYESGKIDLQEYLRRILFYQKRAFSKAKFIDFMLAQSKPYPDMLELIYELKAQYNLQIAVVNNEALELNTYRIKKFKLKSFVDFFVSSCFVHLRKPDPEIFRMALNIAQTASQEVIYIEDREMFVTVAEDVGIKGIHHRDYQSTRQKLANLGLSQ